MRTTLSNSLAPILRLLAAAGPTDAAAQAPSDAGAGDARLIAALESYIPHLMRQNGTPGLNIAIARRGRVIWERGFGMADLGRRTPMTPATVMHSGSMGKTYTGTAVMQLVERGVLGLYEPINRYLKDLQVVNPLGDREITVFDLLTHRSGLSGNTAGSHFAIPKPLREFVPEGYRRTHFEWYQGTVDRFSTGYATFGPVALPTPTIYFADHPAMPPVPNSRSIR